MDLLHKELRKLLEASQRVLLNLPHNDLGRSLFVEQANSSPCGPPRQFCARRGRKEGSDAPAQITSLSISSSPFFSFSAYFLFSSSSPTPSSSSLTHKFLNALPSTNFPNPSVPLIRSNTIVLTVSSPLLLNNFLLCAALHRVSGEARNAVPETMPEVKGRTERR